jgi:hypothetical protein
MEISKDLMLEIELAWSGPIPLLPPGWENEFNLEPRDTYLAFSGKQWREVLFSDIPQYFSPLCQFELTDTESVPDAAAYYFASFMNCFFSVDPISRMSLNMCIFPYLSNLAYDPDRIRFSTRQLRAVDRFLQEATLAFGSYDPEIADKWHQLVERISK